MLRNRCVAYPCLLVLVLLFLPPAAQPCAAQAATGAHLAELTALREKVGSSDTRVRVAALHRAWSIALDSADADVKLLAIRLLKDPANSSSDHIRMPAVHAMAEIADSTGDARVKVSALETLAGPLDSGQVPIRDVAIDAVNRIASARVNGVAAAALRALGPPIKSGNNGVRIPAIDALVRAVRGSQEPGVHEGAADLLVAAMESDAAIGGMEVRMMAVAAMEKVGVDAPTVGAKAKAMGLLQAYAGRGGWEAEAKQRALQAADRIKASMQVP